MSVENAVSRRGVPRVDKGRAGQWQMGKGPDVAAFMDAGVTNVQRFIRIQALAEVPPNDTIRQTRGAQVAEAHPVGYIAVNGASDQLRIRVLAALDSPARAGGAPYDPASDQPRCRAAAAVRPASIAQGTGVVPIDRAIDDGRGSVTAGQSGAADTRVCASVVPNLAMADGGDDSRHSIPGLGSPADLVMVSP